jgi:hypothetical protein
MAIKAADARRDDFTTLTAINFFGVRATKVRPATGCNRGLARDPNHFQKDPP